MKCGETRGGMWEEEEKDKTPKRGYLETLWWEGKGRPWIGCLEIFVQICQWHLLFLRGLGQANKIYLR